MHQRSSLWCKAVLPHSARINCKVIKQPTGEGCLDAACQLIKVSLSMVNVDQGNHHEPQQAVTTLQVFHYTLHTTVFWHMKKFVTS